MFDMEQFVERPFDSWKHTQPCFCGQFRNGY